MSERRILEPGPRHPIAIERHDSSPARVRVGGHVVADAPAHLSLAEASYPAVAYVDERYADAALLERSETTSWCPFKGEASYYHLRLPDGRLIEDAAWVYYDPAPAVAAIKGHLAFYPARVDAIETS
ncbi:MAG: DUF427 domain-containing protein [Pseudomonadota bacterium]